MCFYHHCEVVSTPGNAEMKTNELTGIKTIGDRLRYVREYRGMNQTELSEALDSTQSMLSNLETDASRKPSAPTLLKIAAVLQCNADWILTGRGDPFEINTIGRTTEKRLLSLFREMDPKQQSALLATAEALSKRGA
jgi:transcriptional regulator with XRE-family HTH domain